MSKYRGLNTTAGPTERVFETWDNLLQPKPKEPQHPQTLRTVKYEDSYLPRENSAQS